MSNQFESLTTYLSERDFDDVLVNESDEFRW